MGCSDSGSCQSLFGGLRPGAATEPGGWLGSGRRTRKAAKPVRPGIASPPRHANLGRALHHSVPLATIKHRPRHSHAVRLGFEVFPSLLPITLTSLPTLEPAAAWPRSFRTSAIFDTRPPPRPPRHGCEYGLRRPHSEIAAGLHDVGGILTPKLTANPKACLLEAEADDDDAADAQM